MTTNEVIERRSAPFCGKNIVVAVSGGIAAYKTCELVRLLVRAQAKVRVVMTRAATEFVTPLSFQALSGHPVGTDLFSLTQESEIGHISLAENAALLIIAPATADLIAKLAVGIADDLVLAIALATRAPILMAPAMNARMWEHPFVKANIIRLNELGRVHFIGPDEGDLACGTTGPGRMVEPTAIVEMAGRMLTTQDFRGRTVVVTAGPTREDIDPVRFLSNRSSGKMGYAVARAAAARGANVTLISGPTPLPPPLEVDMVRVATASEMHDATTVRAKAADVIVMAAAVADYRPLSIGRKKLKKDELGDSPKLELTRNKDVLAELGRTRLNNKGGRRPVLVGFAAETDSVEEQAQKKLTTKGCDIVVANDVSEKDSGFDGETNRVAIIGPGTEVMRLPLLTKDEVAHSILDAVRIVLGNC